MKKFITIMLLFIITINGQTIRESLQKKFSNIVIDKINEIQFAKTKEGKSISQIQSSIDQNILPIDSDFRVMLKIRVDQVNDSIKDFLIKEGCEIKNYNNYDMFTWVPFNKLEVIAENDKVLAIIGKGLTRTNSIISEGVALHQGDNSSDYFHADGGGVKVGVISDGMNYSNDSYYAYELPVINSVDNSGNNELYPQSEGTAMMEIIYDFAPAAELYFGGIDNYDNYLDFANRINHLAQQGCKVIVDDIGFIAGYSYFQEMELSAAINQFTNNYNGCYIAAVGNDNGNMYTGTNYTIDETEFLEFNNSTTHLEFTPENSGQVTIVLQWADTWYNPTQDFDLYVHNNTTNAVIASGLNRGSYFNPEEVCTINVTENQKYYLRVKWYNYSISEDNREIKILFLPDESIQELNLPLKSNSKEIFGKEITNNLIGVAATNANNGSTVESFSSRGPAVVFTSGGNIILEQQPKITGADGVSTYVGEEGNFNNPFYGTSAAAPHIAGIAAQYFSKYPNNSSNDFLTSLSNSAISMSDGGSSSNPNYISGYGRADALGLFIEELDVISSVSYNSNSVISNKKIGGQNSIASGITVTIPANTTTVLNGSLTFNSPTSTLKIYGAFLLEDGASLSSVDNIEIYDNGQIVDLSGNLDFKQVTINQKLSDENNIPQNFNAAKWRSPSWINFQTPKNILCNLNTNITLKANQSIVTNEKYNNWENGSNVINHQTFFVDVNTDDLTANFKHAYDNLSIKNSLENSSISGGNIQFKDPWYIDYEDLNFGDSYRNRGTNALFMSRVSPFTPDYITTYENNQAYQGVFLGQGYNPVTQEWTTPYYSVKTTSPQTISINGTDRTFYFQNWKASNNGADAKFQNANALETPVVFNNEGAEVKAVMKGTQLSSNVNGFNNNNQRKIIRTSNGHLHMVYESLGYIWYEYSTDYGSTWLLGNNNKPIEFDEGKNPSLNDYYGVLSVIYQGKGNGTGSTIKVASISNGVVTDTELIAELNDSYTNTEINPVIAFGNDQLFAAIWRGDCADQDFGVSKALNLRTGTISYDYTSNNYQINVHTDQFYPTSGRHIFNTDENSLNPCVEFYNGDDQNPNKLHIVWQQGTSSIKYERLEFTYSNNTLNYSTYALATLSTGSGFTNNYNPSITVLLDNSPVVSWVGYRTLRDERLEKANAGTYEERIVLRRGYSSGSWSSVFNKYDDEVNTPSVNSALMGYALGWSNENGSTNKIVRSDYGNQIFTTTQVGRDVQLSNGSSHNNIRFITLNTSALPYAFYNQPLPTDIPLKTSSLAVANGREGIVTKGEAGFYYLIGDVVLDQTTINFTELTDETTISNETELNSYLTTEEFTINNNSDLTFSVRFGTVDSITTANTLNDNEYVRFRVELVDAATNELLGTFSSVEYTKTNLYQYNNIGYSVNTEGIGNKKVKIRLRVEDNVEAEYTIAQIIADETILGKTNYTEISYLGELSVETYELAQNYPNPFNPETVIYYQIPESGEVSLKVYDMLGRELKTLVNHAQNQGRYEVKFNARDLASGVYIYRLQVNDFVTSKKMMLVK